MSGFSAGAASDGVMVAVSDPVASAFVQSLAHPGTNVTGRSSQSNLMPGYSSICPDPCAMNG